MTNDGNEAAVATEMDPLHVPENYDQGTFERPSLTTDAVVFTVRGDKLHVLLVKRGKHPYKGYWALPGGFAEPGEVLLQTATRELEEETNVRGIKLAHHGIYSTPRRDPRGWIISAGYMGFLPSEALELMDIKAGDDAADVGWFPVDEELQKKLAFDHHLIVREATEKLRREALTTNILAPLFFSAKRDSDGRVELQRKRFPVADLLNIWRIVFQGNAKAKFKKAYRKCVEEGVLNQNKSGLFFK